jgi:2-oxoglutarate ferredoxin oxidoreductase subunit alpha
MQERVKRKFQTARSLVPQPVIDSQAEDASIGIIAFGSTEAAIQEARDQLYEQHNIKTNFMRVRAIPFSEDVRSFIEQHDRCYVVELNRDGQLHQILKIEYPDLSTRLISTSHLDGLPLTARWVREAILAKEV